MKYLIFTFIICVSVYLLVKSNNPRLEFISKDHTNSIKGLAIILVILNHMGGAFGIRYLTPLGGIGVAMFLVCSGYGLVVSYERNGLKGYWNKKIIGVLIPYMIIEIFITLFRQGNTLMNIVTDILIVDSKHPYGWYLKCLLFWYIIFYIIGKLNFLSKSKIYLFYIISLVMIFNKNQLWAGQALSFPLGIILAYYKESIMNIITNRKYIPHTLLLIGIFFLGIKQISIFRQSSYIILNSVQLLINLPIACALSIYLYKFSTIIKNNIFIKVGTISYSLYLIHGYTIKILLKLNYINILMFLVSTFIISFVFENYIIKFINRYISEYKFIKVE